MAVFSFFSLCPLSFKLSNRKQYILYPNEFILPSFFVMPFTKRKSIVLHFTINEKEIDTKNILMYKNSLQTRLRADSLCNSLFYKAFLYDNGC